MIGEQRIVERAASDRIESKESLRVLIIEDSPDDAELILHELDHGGYTVTHRRVETASAMKKALVEEPWDLILSDFSMPEFSGTRALAVLKESGIDIPFIIVSGTIGEETAVEALKAGAHDFLVKDRLARLLPAIERELREAETRRRRTEAEEALRASEERFRALTESANDAVISADDRGNIVYMNGAAERMFGFAASELYGRSLTALMPGRFHEAHRTGFFRFLNTGEPRVAGRTVEFMAQRANGTEFPVDLSLAAWTSAKRTYFTAILRDVSDRKKIEAQLMVSDRMASVGMLAAGVAHEINNPLAAVMANLDLTAQEAARLARTFGDTGALPELIDDARTAAERVRQIVRDLKIFSRAEDDDRGPVDVARVMESSLRLAWNEIRHRARLVKDYGRVPPALASESRLGQVFLNLIVNAAQAIPEGQTESNEIRIRTATDAGGRIIVEVADTGAGMSPAVLKQLFTPFFTTKPAGIGTGLGLSICQRLLEAMNGEIRVESTEGRGTTFRLALPAATLEAKAQVFGPAAREAPVLRGRILVIDDEAMIGSVMKRILQPAHDVMALTSAEVALARITGGERFDVIFCDLMMPQMTGMDLHRALLSLVPEQADQIIFLTGGAFTRAGRLFLDSVTNQRVEKPFDAQHLRALVNDRIR
jgi:PAS domain S-box-containing protein